MWNNYKPFVKWVWWKRQLLTQFENLYPNTFLDQETVHYFEPFIGWWAVFFNLRNKFWLKFKATICDLNSELINTYIVVRNNPEWLIQELSSYEYSKKFFLEIRARDQLENYKTKKTNIERAARFIYLNRTCFNWMYRVNKSWFFNVPFWKYSNPRICDKENLLLCSEALQNTKILNQDYSSILGETKPWDFIYLDPPYDTLSSTASFTDYNEWWFNREEQLRLCNFFRQLSNKKVNAMLSNHSTDRIREAYSWYRYEIVKATRMINSNASKRWAIDEIVILNY